MIPKIKRNFGIRESCLRSSPFFVKDTPVVIDANYYNDIDGEFRYVLAIRRYYSDEYTKSYCAIRCNVRMVNGELDMGGLTEYIDSGCIIVSAFKNDVDTTLQEELYECMSKLGEEIFGGTTYDMYDPRFH